MRSILPLNTWSVSFGQIGGEIWSVLWGSKPAILRSSVKTVCCGGMIDAVMRELSLMKKG